MTFFRRARAILKIGACGIVVAATGIVAKAEETGGKKEYYQAPMHEASWQLSESVFGCALSQEIPLIGQGVFSHRAGEDLEFSFTSYDSIFHSSQVALISIPPPWKLSIEEEYYGIAEKEGALTVSFDEPPARWMMSKMLSGLMPSIADHFAGSNELKARVSLSPLRFQQAYLDFQQCSEQLLPVNFEQIERSTLFWPSGASELSAEAKSLLNNIVSYAKADESIHGFEVDSFTDTAGERRENLLFSEQRAFLVTNYLIARGIDAESIATRAHGEREEYLIVNPEKTQADRDRNRRVNVVLLRNQRLTSASQ